jgi:hypothetical protein
MLTAPALVAAIGAAVDAADAWLAGQRDGGTAAGPPPAGTAPPTVEALLTADAVDVASWCLDPPAPAAAGPDAAVVLPALAVAACWAHDLESAALLLHTACRVDLPPQPALASVAAFLLARQRPDGSFGPSPALLHEVAAGLPADQATDQDPAVAVTLPLTTWCRKALLAYADRAAALR